MYKHKATMTGRRHAILKLIAKGYNNKQIARKLGLTLCNTKLQKWRLYCYLGEIHTAIDAVYMGLQMGYLQMSELCEPMKEEMYESENEKQMYCPTKTRKSNNRDIQTDTKIVPFPAKRIRAV